MTLDARTKLILVALFTTLSVLAIDLYYLLIVFSFLLISVILLKINLIKAVSRLKYLLSVIVFIAIVQSLTLKDGKPLLYIGNFYIITVGGLINGGEFALRMMIIVMASLIVSTSTSREMINGLVKMKLPYEIAFMTSVSLRFLPLFKDEFLSRINAIALRGVDIKSKNVIKKIKIYSYLILPTVSASIVRSRQLAKSIEARGFRAYNKRTMYRQSKLGTADYVITVLAFALFTGYLVIMYYYGGLL